MSGRLVFILACMLVTAVAGYVPGAAARLGTQEITVEMRDIMFSPRMVTISPGTTIVWVNRDPFDHTVTADDGSFNSSLIPPGGVFRFTFQRPGRYPYYCVPHGGPGGVGMSGVVIVGAPQPTPSLPTATPAPPPSPTPRPAPIQPTPVPPTPILPTPTPTPEPSPTPSPTPVPPTPSFTPSPTPVLPAVTPTPTTAAPNAGPPVGFFLGGAAIVALGAAGFALWRLLLVRR